MALSAAAIGAIASAGIAAAQSTFNAGIGAKARKQQYKIFQEQYKQQNELLDKQTAINRENWRMENEYNTPQNQMSRYLSAGINPYNAVSNINGSLSSVSPTSSGSPSSSYDVGSLYDRFNPVSSFTSILQSGLTSSVQALTASQSASQQKELFPSILGLSKNDALRSSNDLSNEDLRLASNKSAFQSQVAQMGFQTAYFTLKAQGVPDIVASELSTTVSSAAQSRLIAEGLGYDNTIKSIDAGFHNEMMSIARDNAVKLGLKTDKEIQKFAVDMENSMKLCSAQCREMYSRASYNDALTTTENFTRSAKRELIKSEAYKNQTEAQRNYELLPYQLGNLREDYRAAKRANDDYVPSSRSRAYHNAYDDNTGFFPTTWGVLLDGLYQLSDAILGPLGTAVKFKNGKSW